MFSLFLQATDYFSLHFQPLSASGCMDFVRKTFDKQIPWLFTDFDYIKEFPWHFKKFPNLFMIVAILNQDQRKHEANQGPKWKRLKTNPRIYSALQPNKTARLKPSPR